MHRATVTLVSPTCGSVGDNGGNKSKGSSEVEGGDDSAIR